MSKYVLLHAPQMAEVAKKAAALDPDIRIGEIDWKRFPDSFPNIFIKGMKELKGRNVVFLASFETPDTIFEQMSVIYALAEFRPLSFKILLPYFPTGTMERIDTEGQVATAAMMAKMFSGIKAAGPGVVPLWIWDIHALQIRHYDFGPNVAPAFKSATKLLVKTLEGTDAAIVFPDDGAWKRFHTRFEDAGGKPLFPFIVCRKVRDGDRRTVTVSEGDPRGKNVVIFDDLIHSGGTLLECAKVMQAAGARSVSVYATHGVMELNAWEKFLKAGFANVWITDSCPTTAARVDGMGPFRVISIASTIVEAIKSSEENA